ncbi:MAG: hypothetical protein OEV45_01810 [Desulfobacteraceae bacterium]|nr:hypothetical protein [Desulfobacteraceae bacterium]
MGGFMMMIGLALGSILGVKYLIWEMLNWPVKIPSQQPLECKKTPLIDWCKVYPYFKNAVKTTALGPFLGKGVYVVNVLTWTRTPVFYISFFLVWYLLAVYNEKTEKFVITF